MAVQMLGIKTKFTDDQGRPLIGGSVHTYYAGTSLPQDTFSDPELTVPNTNPVKLDDTGSANIFLKGTYRVRVFDIKGKFVEEQDNVDQLATASEVFKNKGGLNAANERIDALTSEVNSVKEKTIIVESIADLSTITNPKDGLRVYVKSYHAGLNKGGGYFTYDRNLDKTNADGSQVVDSETLGSFDGTPATLEEYLIIQGSGSGSGCWVKQEEEYLCPYAFGYADDYLTGLLSVYAIIVYAKEQGHGHLKIPEGQDFYLGSNKQNPNNFTPSLYEFGDNFSWYIPSNTRMLINGHVPIWHQPTGYGHDGGTKNFKIYGGGVIEGTSLIPADYCFFSMNFIHTTGIKCYDITFLNAANGHVFDLMGCKDVHIKGCKFIGSTMDFGSTRSGNEVIQMGGASDGGRAHAVAKYNMYMDYTITHNVVIEDCEFKSYRDPETGEIITYTQKALGDHVSTFASIDKIVLRNLYIEQTDPNAASNKYNYAMIALPPAEEVLIDNVYLKMDEGGRVRMGVLIFMDTQCRVLDEKTNTPTDFPSTKLIPRVHKKTQHIVRNLTIDVGDRINPKGQGYVTKCSTDIDGLKIVCNLEEGFGSGFDAFNFARSYELAEYGLRGIEENPVFRVKNATFINVRNIIYAPTIGEYYFENIYLEGGQWAFRSIPDGFPGPSKLVMNGIQHVYTPKGRDHYSMLDAKHIHLNNCSFMDKSDIRASVTNTEKVVVTNSSFNNSGILNTLSAVEDSVIINCGTPDGIYPPQPTS